MFANERKSWGFFQRKASSLIRNLEDFTFEKEIDVSYGRQWPEFNRRIHTLIAPNGGVEIPVH